MRIGVYNYHSGKNQSNEMFENPKLGIGDDLMKPFQILRDTFRKDGHELVSIADGPMENFDALLFIEWPTLPFLMNPYFKEARRMKKKLFLIIMESEVIRPSNYTTSNHKYFDTIFTWKDDIVDEKKYIKYNWPQNLPAKVDFPTGPRTKFLTLISSHKGNSHPFELYSERIRAIRYFEKYAPQDFDLYGGGWNSISFRSNLLKYAPLLPGFGVFRNFCQKYFFKPFPSWKGKVASKNDTLSQYKFAICYENAKNIPGYITEKIFDCFFAGCIPVYLGPPNIDTFIPKNTYIDKNLFPTYDSLYAHLRGMSEETIQEYQKNMQTFLEGEMGHKFSSEYFASILRNSITQSN